MQLLCNMVIGSPHWCPSFHDGNIGKEPSLHHVSDCTTALSLVFQLSFRFKLHPLEGDKPFTQAFQNWEGDAWELWQSYVQSKFSEWPFLHLSHRNLGLTPSFQPQRV